MKKAKQEQEWVFRLHHLAAAYYRKVLSDPAMGRKAGLGGKRDKTPDGGGAFPGYAPPSWTALVELFAKGISLDRAEKVTSHWRGGGLYNRFRDRLIFPIMTPQGKTAALAHGSWGRTTKYLGPPDTPSFIKAVSVWLYQAREPFGRQVKPCRGLFRCHSGPSAGIEYVVALGTAHQDQKDFETIYTTSGNRL